MTPPLFPTVRGTLELDVSGALVSCTVLPGGGAWTAAEAAAAFDGFAAALRRLRRRPKGWRRYVRRMKAAARRGRS